MKKRTLLMMLFAVCGQTLAASDAGVIIRFALWRLGRTGTISCAGKLQQ